MCLPSALQLTTNQNSTGGEKHQILGDLLIHTVSPNGVALSRPNLWHYANSIHISIDLCLCSPGLSCNIVLIGADLRGDSATVGVKSYTTSMKRMQASFILSQDT